MKRKYLIIALVLNFTFFFSYAQQDCSTAASVCVDTNSGGVVNGSGRDDFFGATSSGCLELNLTGDRIESNSYWFKIRMGASGQFGFSIKPNVETEDWDFAVYGPDKSCAVLGDPIACNYSKVSPTGYTGVGVDPDTNTQTEAYDDWMNVQVGEIYLIMVNQYDGDNAGFEISWEGAAIDSNPDPLDCSTAVELGLPRVVCEGGQVDLQPLIFGENLSYMWRYLDESTGNFELFDPLHPFEILRVRTAGTYQVEVTNTVTGESDTDEVEVLFSTVPAGIEPEPLIECDYDNDGFADFDLEKRTDDILGGLLGVTVSYHALEILAESGDRPITGTFNSASTVVYARVTNILNRECFDIVPLELIVSPPILPMQPPDLNVCDIDNDGIFLFDLEEQTPIILNGQTGIVTYYERETLANDRKGWIVNSDAYSTDSRTVWVRVEVSPESDCFEILTFEINVSTKPEINIAESILQCDDDNDGIGIFDLNELKDREIAGFQSLEEFEVLYYTTPYDADADENRIEMPYVTQTPYAEELIYARIQAIKVPECFEVSTFTIQMFDNPLPTPSEEMTPLSYCDDISDGSDTNGIYNFDLTEKATELLNGQSSFVFDIEYYRDPDYMDLILDPTNHENRIAGGETIYVRVLNGNPNNEACVAETSFFIEVKPLPRALDTTYVLMQCDEDASPDGITNFNLSEADDFIRLGDETLEVTYHLTSEDATSGFNNLNKSSFSNSRANAIFARVSAMNGCYRIVDVELETSITRFPPNYVRRFEVCDADDIADGKSLFNLSSATSEIISLFDSQNLRVSFYRNENDALGEENPISEPSLYENEVAFYQIVWVRVESAVDGGCFGIGPVIELVVNRRPEFELIEQAFVCLNDVPLNVSVQNPAGGYTYVWRNNQGAIVSVEENVEIYEAGIYSVIATSLTGCDSFEQQVEVTASEIPTVTRDDITVVDNSNSNSITIRNSGQNLGIGDYEFSLDDRDGTYQDLNVFYDVLPGRHVVYVRDKNGCGLALQVVHVLGFPKFFTPNEDGVNDYWNVRGVNSTDFPVVIVYIFDRHGKHLTTIDGDSRGWNGIYNGTKSISTDYWYLAELTDAGGNRSQYKGHFSLIRR